jgi:hypothetical protein
MDITHKIKLDSGKEIELTDSEYDELMQKFGETTHQPTFVPYVPDYQPPVFPRYPWNDVWYSASELTNGN